MNYLMESFFLLQENKGNDDLWNAAFKMSLNEEKHGYTLQHTHTMCDTDNKDRDNAPYGSPDFSKQFEIHHFNINKNGVNVGRLVHAPDAFGEKDGFTYGHMHGKKLPDFHDSLTKKEKSEGGSGIRAIFHKFVTGKAGEKFIADATKEKNRILSEGLEEPTEQQIMEGYNKAELPKKARQQHSVVAKTATQKDPVYRGFDYRELRNQIQKLKQSRGEYNTETTKEKGDVIAEISDKVVSDYARKATDQVMNIVKPAPNVTKIGTTDAEKKTLNKRIKGLTMAHDRLKEDANLFSEAELNRIAAILSVSEAVAPSQTVSNSDTVKSETVPDSMITDSKKPKVKEVK